MFSILLKTSENPYDHCFKYSIRHVTYICSLRSLAITLFCSLIWDNFSVFSFCLSLCAYFYVLGKSSMSPVPEGNSLMKKRSSSALLCSISCSPGPGASVYPMCAASALLFCSGCFILQASCLQGLSLPVMGSVLFLA